MNPEKTGNLCMYVLYIMSKTPEKKTTEISQGMSFFGGQILSLNIHMYTD